MDNTVVTGPVALAIRGLFVAVAAVVGWAWLRLILHRTGCRDVDGVVVAVSTSTSASTCAKGYTPAIEYTLPDGSSGRCEGMTTSRNSEIGDKVTVLIDGMGRAKTLGSYQFAVWFAGIFAAVFLLLAFFGTVHMSR